MNFREQPHPKIRYNQEMEQKMQEKAKHQKRGQPIQMPALSLYKEMFPEK